MLISGHFTPRRRGGAGGAWAEHGCASAAPLTIARLVAGCAVAASEKQKTHTAKP